MQRPQPFRIGLAALALGGALTLTSTALAAGAGDPGPSSVLASAAPADADGALVMRAFVGANRVGGHGPRGGAATGTRPAGQRGGPGFGSGFGLDFATVAKTLNLTTQQLRQQLQSGKSVAQVAQAQNVALQTVEDAITAAAKARLDQAVAAGRLTSAQETARLTALQSGLATRLNATGAQYRRGLGRGRRPAATVTATPTSPASSSGS